VPGCASAIDEHGPDLVVLSPGSGRPSDFACEQLLGELDARGLPLFGVCLGLQAMVEHAGGELTLLPRASVLRLCRARQRVAAGGGGAGFPRRRRAGGVTAHGCTPSPAATSRLEAVGRNRFKLRSVLTS
jgi:anthranilate synthase